MPEYSEDDRIRVTRPITPKYEGRKGTVQWVHHSKGQRGLGVLLDGDEHGQTFFPHEVELID